MIFEKLKEMFPNVEERVLRRTEDVMRGIAPMKQSELQTLLLLEILNKIGHVKDEN
jgi:hypothetical protein